MCTLYTPGVAYGRVKYLSPVHLRGIARSRWASKVAVRSILKNSLLWCSLRRGLNVMRSHCLKHEQKPWSCIQTDVAVLFRCTSYKRGAVLFVLKYGSLYDARLITCCQNSKTSRVDRSYHNVQEYTRHLNITSILLPLD